MESGCGVHDLPWFCNKIWHANNIVYRSVIYRSVFPPTPISSSLYPRLKNKWATETHETSRRNWLNMYAKRRVCFVLLLRHILWSLSPRSAWCRKAFSLFAFIAVNVGCNHHISARKWELRAEPASKMKLQNNFQGGRGGKNGRWGRKKKTLGNKKPPQNYIILPMLSVFSSKIPGIFPLFFIILSHKREEWRLTAGEESSQYRLVDEWKSVVWKCKCLLLDPGPHAWGISDICLFLSSK